ncbi:MAG TPA: peptidase M12 [Saprospirales bacterium]|nr:peptidase M12 [Saprospirales bacterium]
MKNAILSLACVAALFLLATSCNKENVEAGFAEYTLSQEEIAEISGQFCSTNHLHDYNDHAILEENGAAEDRGTGIKGKFWPAGKVLKVRFQNGSATLQTKVLNYAKTWSNHANVTFVKVTSGTSDIRVRFGNLGHNSFVGTDNLLIPQDVQTMNLQFTDNTSESEIRRVSLHEFGHALGLMHEHQNPFAAIPWDKPKVYAYYAATQGWSQQQVDNNVLNTLGWGPAQHSPFDAQSIMAYSIPASLTTNGFSIPWNTELSAMDKEFIGKAYSSTRIQVRHAANINGNITVYLNGVATTLSKNETLQLPAAASGNVLNIWECPNSCMWSAFNVSLGFSYRIISSPNNPNDLTLALEI